MDRRERQALDHYLTTEPSWRTDDEEATMERPNTSRVLTLVRSERERQEVLKLQGRFTYTLADPMPNVGKLAAVTEELGEVARELMALEGLVATEKGSKDRLRKELVQVAALSVAWVESLL